ncbi:hypothetical protein JTE90_019696, partial [Oedothorax gibbosus]
MEIDQPRPDTVAETPRTTAEDRHIEEMLVDLASCASFPDFLLETNQDASTTASCVPFATTSDSSVVYIASVPFATTPGGSSVAYVLPFATTGTSDTTPLVTSDTTPLVLSDTSSSCIVAPLPAPRLWRRTQRQRTAA